MKPLIELYSSLSLNPKNSDIYQLAFTHKSYTNEKGVLESNERLEFLGDAVLELLISEYLYSSYPEANEGEMTGLRSATVRKETLAQVAKKLHFGDYLLLSKGEQKGHGRQKDYLLANTFEAFLGAMFLDQGINACSDFLKENLFGLIQEFKEKDEYIGPKTRFQEYAQLTFNITPHYTFVSEDGPDHNKIFTMAAMIGEKEIAHGVGNSKQKAENNAAEIAYNTLSPSSK